MKVNHSHRAKRRDAAADVQNALARVSVKYLNQTVEAIAIPRHADAEASNNRKVATYIKREFESFGYKTEFQGENKNVVALPGRRIDEPLILIGAHYDSVPGTPGADDNASAVAAMLACARSLSRTGIRAPVCFVAFNREEDGFLGSEEFVDSFLRTGNVSIKHAHILEMVGYASDEKGSQRVPPLIPIKLPDTGNFLGVLGNRDSVDVVDTILTAGKTYLPDFHVIGLKLYLGSERFIPNMNRSDHVPFWEKGIPATMWTDTAEFRNPNYHRRTDTPDTLNYEFLANTSKLLVASILD